MKKFKVMLPVLAVVFAVVAAVASPITAYYQSGSMWVAGTTEQSNCQVSNDPANPICTIKVGTLHKQAFQNSDGTGVLRDLPLN